MRRFLVLGAAAFLAASCTSPPDHTARRVRADAAPTAAPGPAVTSTAPPRTVKAASTGLQRFVSCPQLLAHLKQEALAKVGPYGLGGGVVAMPLAGRRDVAEMAADSAASPGSAAPAPAHSTTNVQEAGVDEPDLVKTDGRRIFALARGRLHAVLPGATPRLAGSLGLPDGWMQDLLLAGDRVVVFGTGAEMASPERQVWVGDAVLHVVDVADPAAMRVVSTLRLEGSYVSSRLHQGMVRVVLRSPATRLPFTHPTRPGTEPAAAAHNRRLVEDSTLEDWLPRWRLEEHGGTKPEASEGTIAGCSTAYRPAEPAGLGMLSVITVDPADPKPDPGASVVASGDLVYASQEALYVATGRWMGLEAPAADIAVPGRVLTQIHRFDLGDPRAARYTATGEVPGYLLNQWSMSEHEGHLRVATTLEGGMGGGPASQSGVTILSVDDLKPVGAVDGLGVGERIYAVRFMGDTGYVVTFRQVDPLYTLDLSDPRRPRVTGELKIPGYSAYLHPVDEGLLLGVGQDADEQGRTLGTKVSLFDVSDPAEPRRIHELALGGHSEIESDHHAFLWWAPTRTAVVPVQVWEDRPRAEAAVLRVGRTIERAGAISHDGRGGGGHPEEHLSMVRRSLVVGATLYTVSEAGILASDVEELTDRGWVAFT